MYCTLVRECFCAPSSFAASKDRWMYSKVSSWHGEKTTEKVGLFRSLTDGKNDSEIILLPTVLYLGRNITKRRQTWCKPPAAACQLGSDSCDYVLMISRLLSWISQMIRFRHRHVFLMPCKWQFFWSQFTVLRTSIVIGPPRLFAAPNYNLAAATLLRSVKPNYAMLAMSATIVMHLRKSC